MRNKFFRKFLSIMFIFTLTLTNIPVSSAFSETNDVHESPLITSIENLLSITDFSYSNISLGNNIPTYVIENDTIKASEVQYYPVLNDNTIVGMISSYGNDNTTPSITFTTAYNDILNNFITSNNEIALVGNIQDFIVISRDSSTSISGNNFDFIRNDIIQYTPITKYSDINITLANSSSKKLVASSYGYGLSVPSKKQQTDTNCWAACVASVGQYKTGINKDSNYVSKTLGVTGGGNMLDISRGLSTIYNLSNTPYADPFYFNKLMTQINSDKPVIAGFISGGYGHAVVLCGYGSSSSSASFTYMDPWYANAYTSNIVQDGNFTFTLNGSVYSLIHYDLLN